MLHIIYCMRSLHSASFLQIAGLLSFFEYHMAYPNKINPCMPWTWSTSEEEGHRGLNTCLALRVVGHLVALVLHARLSRFLRKLPSLPRNCRRRLLFATTRHMKVTSQNTTSRVTRMQLPIHTSSFLEILISMSSFLIQFLRDMLLSKQQDPRSGAGVCGGKSRILSLSNCTYRRYAISAALRMVW